LKLEGFKSVAKETTQELNKPKTMVKQRANGELTFDENGYKRRAACVVFRDEREDELLLITSKHFNSERNWWIVPGGSIEADEDPMIAAEREVYEESGVKGRILRSIGQVLNDKKMTRTWVFVMIADDEMDQWDDSEALGRQRQWFSSDVARRLLSVHKPVQVNYIDLAMNRKGHRCDSLPETCNPHCSGEKFNKPVMKCDPLILYVDEASRTRTDNSNSSEVEGS